MSTINSVNSNANYYRYNLQNMKNNSTCTLFSSLSSKESGGTSLVSSLGDLKMIQSGVYKKALQKVYANREEAESIAESGEADSNVSLSNLKSSAAKLNEAATKLQNADYKKVTGEDILEDAKSFVSSYNNTVNTTKNMNSYSILQTAVWMTDQMSVGEGVLNKVGITINADNTLSLDEEKFKTAESSDLKALFSGSGSFASRIASKASSLATQSANQLSVNSGNSMYNMLGMLG